MIYILGRANHGRCKFGRGQQLRVFFISLVVYDAIFDVCCNSAEFCRRYSEIIVGKCVFSARPLQLFIKYLQFVADKRNKRLSL